MEDGLVQRLADELPLAPTPYSADLDVSGLVIVDAVNGFCTVGAGNLAPVEPNPQIASMIDTIDPLARHFQDNHRPILAFLDTHEPGKAEPPYPPHCERGTGEENLVPQLAWLEDASEALLIRKDVINGFVGAMEPMHDGRHGAFHNRLVDWVNLKRLQTLIVSGICTDICVMDLVLTLLAARNHGMMPTLCDVVVLAPACATYALPVQAAEDAGLPKTAAHPQDVAHYMGLWFMASRGAVIADRLDWTS